MKRAEEMRRPRLDATSFGIFCPERTLVRFYRDNGSAYQKSLQQNLRVERVLV